MTSGAVTSGVFDWWFYAVDPVFNGLILLDVIGILAMLGACLRGYWLLKPGE